MSHIIHVTYMDLHSRGFWCKSLFSPCFEAGNFHPGWHWCCAFESPTEVARISKDIIARQSREPLATLSLSALSAEEGTPSTSTLHPPFLLFSQALLVQPPQRRSPPPHILCVNPLLHRPRHIRLPPPQPIRQLLQRNPRRLCQIAVVVCILVDFKRGMVGVAF